MPSERHHYFGNLYIQFDVKFPKTLTGPNGEGMTDAQKKMLEQVLPPRKQKTPQPPADAMVEDFTLDEIDENREAGRAQGATVGDEDDEDMHGAGERVQCASQ